MYICGIIINLLMINVSIVSYGVFVVFVILFIDIKILESMVVSMAIVRMV